MFLQLREAHLDAGYLQFEGTLALALLTQLLAQLARLPRQLEATLKMVLTPCLQLFQACLGLRHLGQQRFTLLLAPGTRLLNLRALLRDGLPPLFEALQPLPNLFQLLLLALQACRRFLLFVLQSLILCPQVGERLQGVGVSVVDLVTLSLKRVQVGCGLLSKLRFELVQLLEEGFTLLAEPRECVMRLCLLGFGAESLLRGLVQQLPPLFEVQSRLLVLLQQGDVFCFMGLMFVLELLQGGAGVV
jgi:hypothetical protein